VLQGVVDRQNGPSRIAEYLAHSFRLKAFPDNLGACHHPCSVTRIRSHDPYPRSLVSRPSLPARGQPKTKKAVILKDDGLF
jgi:hypothetical protein